MNRRVVTAGAVPVNGLQDFHGNKSVTLLILEHKGEFVVRILSLDNNSFVIHCIDKGIPLTAGLLFGSILLAGWVAAGVGAVDAGAAPCPFALMARASRRQIMLCSPFPIDYCAIL